jgi:hypothetical protein
MTDQQKSFLAANWFKLFFVAVTVLAILVYFVRESRLDSCLNNATDMYSKEWDETCSREGKGKNCVLPKYLADGVNKYRETYINDCYRRYSFK